MLRRAAPRCSQSCRPSCARCLPAAATHARVHDSLAAGLLCVVVPDLTCLPGPASCRTQYITENTGGAAPQPWWVPASWQGRAGRGQARVPGLTLSVREVCGQQSACPGRGRLLAGSWRACILGQSNCALSSPDCWRARRQSLAGE